MKISKKNCETLERYGQGALARREAKKVQLEFIEEIASKFHYFDHPFSELPKPSYPADGRNELVFINQPMIPQEELEKFMSDENGGKNLNWVNYFKPVPDQQSSSPSQFRKYKGQWRKDQQTWEGIGVLLFPDGSQYQGMTKNELFEGKGRMTHANNDIYQGMWKNGKANGYGVFVDTNGSMYEGEWVDD